MKCTLTKALTAEHAEENYSRRSISGLRVE
jgi:hypothetical protein